ncbi:MAG: hypothetical protein ABII80_03605 [bacterium]
MTECNPKDCGFSSNGVCLEDEKNLSPVPTDAWKEACLQLDSGLVKLKKASLAREDYEREAGELISQFPQCVIIPFIEASRLESIDDLEECKKPRKSSWV